MQKRGQLTAFIIIGIVIVLATSTVIYLAASSNKAVITTEIKKIEEVPSDLMPVKANIEDCIGKLTEEALKISSEHGGYIYKQFNANSDSTEGNAVEFYPGSGFYVPYWFYMKSPNKCQGSCIFTDELMPQLCKQGRNCFNSGPNSIERQLEQYITNNLDKCIAFEEFNSQGIIISKKGSIKTDAMIRPEDVLVSVTYPLSVEKDSRKTEITSFAKSTESDIAEMYEIAYDITNYESTNCFIGSQVRNYYSFFTGLDENMLPPIYEVTVAESNKVTWTLDSVRQNLIGKTANAVQLIGIYNTSGFKWPMATEQDNLQTRQGVYDQFVFYPLRRYHDATVSLSYLPWHEPYLDIQPREGSMLVPTELGGGGGIAGIVGSITKTMIYEFFYQYSFPVIVEIRKEDKLGKQHIFRFALEENIRGNRCFNANASLVHQASLSSMVCDMDQRTNNISIIVREKDNNPIPDVAVSFFADQSCPLGLTGADGMLNTTYPDAFGGLLKFEKDGFVDRWVHQSGFSSGSQLVVMLEGFTYLNATLKKLRMNVPNECCSQGTNLGSQEKTIINLEKVVDANNPYDKELTQPLLFDGDDLSTLSHEIKLVPGKYKIDARYFSDMNYTMQAGCMKVETDCDWTGSCSYDYLPKKNETSKPIGGAVFNDETGYWEVSESGLQGKSNIEFYVIRVPNANCISTDNCILPNCIGLDEMGKVGNYSKTFREKITPLMS